MDFAAADPYRYNQQLATRRDSRISLGGGPPGGGQVNHHPHPHPASSPLSLPPPPPSAGSSHHQYQLQHSGSYQNQPNNNQQTSAYNYEPASYGYEDEYDVSIPPPSAGGLDGFPIPTATSSSSHYLPATSKQDYYGPPSGIRPDSGVYSQSHQQSHHQHVVAGPSSGNLPLTGELSPAPGYRLLHPRTNTGGATGASSSNSNGLVGNDLRTQSGGQSRELVETDSRTFNRYLPPLDVPRQPDGFDPTLRRNSTAVSPNQYLPPPLTAGIILPGPYPAYQQHQDRYLPPPPHQHAPYQHHSHGPHSSPFGLEEPRHHSLGSRALAGRPTPGYPSTSNTSSGPLDPLRDRFPTPALKYLLPPGTAPEDIPSTDYAYSLIATEEAKYRRARQAAARTGREIVFEPLDPIVYVDPVVGSHYTVPPSAPLGNTPIGGPVTRAAHVRRRELEEGSSASSYGYHNQSQNQGYPPYRADEYPFPTHQQSQHQQQQPYPDHMPPRRAPTTGSRVGLVSGSVHAPSVDVGRGYADSPGTGSRRSTMGNNHSTSHNTNMSDLPIVRSTRAKVYRKDLVTVDGRQHSVTIVDDDESGDDGTGTGQKRKVGGGGCAAGGSAAAAAKKRKVNGDVESAPRRIAGRALEKLDVRRTRFSGRDKCDMY
jgi:hypothetical protein